MRSVLPALTALIGLATADFLIYTYTDNSVDGVNAQFVCYPTFSAWFSERYSFHV